MASPALKKLIKMGILPEGRKAWDAQVRAMADDPTLIEDFDIRVQSLEETDPALFNEIVSYLDPEDGIGGLTRMGDDLYGAEPAKKTGIRGKKDIPPETIESNVPETTAADKDILEDAPAEPKKAGGKKAAGKKKDAEPLESNEENMFLLDNGLTEDQIRKMTPASRAETLKDFGFKGGQAAEPASPQGGTQPGGGSDAMQKARAMLAGSQPAPPSGPTSFVGANTDIGGFTATMDRPPQQVALPTTFSMDTMGMPSGSLADMGNVAPGNPGVMFSESVLPRLESMPGVQMMDAADLPEEPDAPAMDMSRLSAANFPPIDKLMAGQVDPLFARMGEPRFQNRGLLDDLQDGEATALPNEPPSPGQPRTPGIQPFVGTGGSAPPPPPGGGQPDNYVPPWQRPFTNHRSSGTASQYDPTRPVESMPPVGDKAVDSKASEGDSPPWEPVTSRAPEFLKRMGSNWITKPIDHIARNAIPYGTAAGLVGLAAASRGPAAPPVPQEQMDAVNEMRAKARADLESMIGPMAIPLPPGMKIRAVPQSE